MKRNRMRCIAAASAAILILSGCVAFGGAESTPTAPPATSAPVIATTTPATEVVTGTPESATEPTATTDTPESTTTETTTETTTATAPPETPPLTSEVITTTATAPPPATSDTTTVTTTETSSEYRPLDSYRETTSRYGYSYLSVNEKKVYNQIVELARSFKSGGYLVEKMTRDQVVKIYNILFQEELDLFYLDHRYEIRYDSTETVHQILLSYRFTSDEVDDMNSAVDARCDEIISKITVDMTDFDKLLLFHDEIIKNCDYDDNSRFCRTAYGALVAGKAVCHGYAAAMAELCNRVGIPNIIAVGFAGEEHMWNMVNLDGAWYNIDVTWDDPVLDNISTDRLPDELRADYVDYSYFMVGNEEIAGSHSFDTQYITYPAANGEVWDYYVVNDLYATNYPDAEEVLIRAIKDAAEAREPFAYIKLDREFTFDWVMDKLFGEEKLIFYVLDEANNSSAYKFNPNRVAYYTREEMHTIQIRIIYN